MSFVTVSTFLWDDPARKRDYKFDVSHVVVLRNMVARHLTLPHEFVCVTDTSDKAKELAKAGIRPLALDWRKHVPGTCFVRLMLRRPDIGGLLGRRILNLDIDCCITGNIDSIVDRPGDAVFWRNPNWPKPRRAFYQTSIQLFTAGARSELWTDFDPVQTPQWVNRRYGGAEQAWVSERLSEDEAHWTDADGIYGAMRLGDIADGVQGQLPENAKIVFFPGNRMPDQPQMREQFPWLETHYR